MVGVWEGGGVDTGCLVVLVFTRLLVGNHLRNWRPRDEITQKENILSQFKCFIYLTHLQTSDTVGCSCKDTLLLDRRDFLGISV